MNMNMIMAITIHCNKLLVWSTCLTWNPAQSIMMTISLTLSGNTSMKEIFHVETTRNRKNGA